MDVSRQVRELMAMLGPVAVFFDTSTAQRRAAGPGISDFVAGDPQETALPGFVDALRRHAVPERPDWYAYKDSEPGAQAAAAKGLRERLDLPIEPEDVIMTNGAIAGLGVCLRVVCDPGDEVVIVVPPHFLYEPLIHTAGATAVRVPVDSASFELDPAAVEAAITDRTRAIIVNSPHNPTGKIFSDDTLRGLAEVLSRASERNGRTVYLLSDEAYQRILFDGRPFHTPAAHYPHTFLIYTYGKTLLTPGQRLGYVALAPGTEDREELRLALFAAQLTSGWAYPNALLQHALGDLESLSIDVEHLQRKRDRMVGGLRELGYELHVPEATFYLLPRSPDPDDVAFTERLARERVFVMPGTLLEAPGFFRISLTASDEMIERSWPGFERALVETK